MPFVSFRPEFHQIDEFDFDSAFVNSDNSASQRDKFVGATAVSSYFGDYTKVQ